MSTQIQGHYFGTRGPLFRLYFLTAFLTLITLGIYRFWAKTRIRKYIWSATTGDNDSFEYTGTGLEKFLGFLVAIVILAIYLGIVQMVLFFFGLNLFVDPETEMQALAQIGAIYITLLAVLPLMLFAQYRARRYKMARSRWRGIRFGMENGAWGYAARALGYYLLNAITLGLLNPLATFKLEKYMADRSWYGDAQFEQTGRWQDLYAGMKHVFIGLAIMIVGGLLGFASGSPALGGIGIFVGYIWLLIGLIYYRVYAFNYLTRHKVLDGQVTFEAKLETGTILTIIVVGTIILTVLLAIIFGVIGAIFASSMDVFVGGGLSQPGSAPTGIALAINAILYVGAILVAGGLSMVLITQPIIEHAVNNVIVHNADHLNAIQQRAADAGADAEGFADALDVGGAI
ncbi:YjgN family protein [Tateyamaria armeniaca]|uniref:YjgN family protein n=1 Tax=Tateyamaria armeniaca TaxID=2518930 RepID=A0ABW8UVH7_9RHOB